MSIGNIGGAGGVIFGNIQDVKNLPLQTLTALVMAEVMQTREAEQQQKVEEIAAQNAKAKQYNDALGEIAGLSSWFSSDSKSTEKRELVKGDHKTYGADAMSKWADVANGKTTEISVPTKKTDEEGNSWIVSEKKSLAGLSFEQKLDLMGPDTTPSITNEMKEAMRGRAKLADLSKEYGMLTGGTYEAGQTYANIAHGDPSKGTLETLKTKLRTAAEAISTNNQLEMIKLQQLIGAVDAAKTALTQFVKTAGDAEKEIVQKF